MEKLFPLLDKINSEKKPSYITGDFNIDLLKINKETNINAYFEMISN